MVSGSMRTTIEAMSVDERLELLDFIESTVEASNIELSGDQLATIRSRRDEMDARAQPAMDWSELDARIGDRWA